MSQPCVVITAAVTTEAAPLVRRLGLRRDFAVLDDAIVYTGVHEQQRIVVVVTGIGPGRAARLTGQAIDRCRPSAMILTGFAGGVNPRLKAGDVIVPAVVEDERGGQTLRPTIFADNLGQLRTAADLVSTPTAKAIHFASGADAVDMETAAMAAVCQQRQVRWLCVRVISDEAHEQLPRWLLALNRPDGRPDLLAAVMLAVMRPHYIRRLIALGRASTRAAQHMAHHVAGLLRR